MDCRPKALTSNFAPSNYDRDFTDTDIGRWLRERVWKRLAALFQPGDFVLELGCGTGEDAVWLAQRGVQVLATDVSAAMLEQTLQKAHRAGMSIQTQILDLNALPPLDRQFDGVFSNFGPVNCTRDWDGLAAWLAEVVRPSGFVGLGVMSPFCLWETLWHGLHLDFGTAFRRFNRRSTFGELTIYYPGPRQMRRAFQSQFQLVSVRGIGVFLPPSDAFGVIDKRPVLAQRLKQLEERLAHCWPFRTWADHYWIEFRRRPARS